MNYIKKTSKVFVIAALALLIFSMVPLATHPIEAFSPCLPSIADEPANNQLSLGSGVRGQEVSTLDHYVLAQNDEGDGEEEEGGGFPAGAVLFGILVVGVIVFTVRARRGR
jgi:hypothetical protein